MTKKTRETILAAANLIRQGWAQKVGHKYVDGKHYYCMLAALAKFEPPHDFSAAFEVSKYLNGRGHCGITAYNDAPGRTQAEVIALLEAVANQMGDES
ncbi:MAG: hypothetical protein P4L67_04530 [Candidatus Pacebacteria bacterium]|nr:hypothetical protein [Candidatus Paceibacterota bacterium]